MKTASVTESAVDASSQPVGRARNDPTNPRRVLAFSVSSPPEATSNTSSLATHVSNAVTVAVYFAWSASARSPASTERTFE